MWILGVVQNPLAYGISWAELTSDPRLDSHRRKLITDAARELERSKMARFDERSGNLYVTGGYWSSSLPSMRSPLLRHTRCCVCMLLR